MALNIENYLPGVRDAGNPGLATNEPVVFGSAATVTFGTTATFQAPVTVQSTLVGQLTNIVTSTTSQAVPVANSGSIYVINSAGGQTLTLPAPSVGLTYEFVIGTRATSGTHAIVTNNTTATFFNGFVLVASASNGTVGTFVSAGTAAAALVFNGTTTGGSVGTWVQVSCISATTWAVTGNAAGSGVIATPFQTG